MTSKNRKQLPYFERIPIEERPPFVFQERDLEVLKVVMTYRVVDSEIISALISGGNWGITQRLTKLYHWEFLSRPKDQIVLRIQQKHRHLIYTLDSEGVRCLVNELGLPRDKIRSHLKEPHHQFLEHSLMVSRLHACFELAIEHRDDLEFINLAAAEDGEHSVFWRQDTGLNTRVRIETDKGRRWHPVSPDASLGIQFKEAPEGQQVQHMFVECDRGTVSRSRFRNRMRAYQKAQAERRYRKLGVERFLVLTVTETDVRTQALIKDLQETQNLKGWLNMFLFTSEERFDLSRPHMVLEAIWMSARDGTSQTHSLVNYGQGQEDSRSRASGSESGLGRVRVIEPRKRQVKKTNSQEVDHESTRIT